MLNHPKSHATTATKLAEERKNTMRASSQKESHLEQDMKA
jgi:hypothetical protein